MGSFSKSSVPGGSIHRIREFELEKVSSQTISPTKHKRLGNSTHRSENIFFYEGEIHQARQKVGQRPNYLRYHKEHVY